MDSYDPHDGNGVTVYSWRWWIRALSLVLGVFGLAVAISSVVVALPNPAAGGTCGPGTKAESPIAAFFDPVSIGAQSEPPTSATEARLDWLAFVGECQASADGRVLLGLAVLLLSVGTVLGGFLLTRRPATAGDVRREAPVRYSPPPSVPPSWSSPAWGPGAGWGPGGYRDVPSAPPP